MGCWSNKLADFVAFQVPYERPLLGLVFLGPIPTLDKGPSPIGPTNMHEVWLD